MENKNTMLSLIRKIEKSWYNKKPNWLAKLCLPFSGIYWFITSIRRVLYKNGLLKSFKLQVPVIVVGNITVGGTGKTPVVIYLVELLRQSGFNPGVISRGYKGHRDDDVLVVGLHADPKIVGDEAALMVNRLQCPIVIGKDRVAAGNYLQDKFPVDVIICDDGLQHYALQRDIELVVIDGERRFGNGYCLPAGPLRELPARLHKIDAVLVNGGTALPGEFTVQMQGNEVYNLHDPKCICSVTKFLAQPVHAIAGIGNPDKFFQYLRGFGLTIIAHSFPDHHYYVENDLRFGDEYPILMTEKDAVKCQQFALHKFWVLPISIKLPVNCERKILQLLNKPKNDR